MGSAKDSKSASSEVVVVPFAYAVAKGSAQVVQLVKGDVVDADLYDKDSLEHLRSIGFLGSPDK
jgi:hypothetical protein